METSLNKTVISFPLGAQIDAIFRGKGVIIGRKTS